MSKRPPTNDTTNSAIAKKPRNDIDDTVVEVRNMSKQLLDSLKAQKATVQWGHTTCRDDTMASIKKAESLISSTEMLETKAKEQVIVITRNIWQEANQYYSASSAVDKLIDALVESEINLLNKALEKYNFADDEYGEYPEATILEGFRKYTWEIKHDVKKQLKEKLKEMTVDEVIKKVHAETKSAYKSAAKKKIAEILEEVWL